MLRDKVKNYGTQKQIEGEYKESDNCIIIEDVITTGSSVKESLSILESKIKIISICSILNRSNLEQINNYNLEFLFNKNYFL